jgi:hypothetical protein
MIQMGLEEKSWIEDSWSEEAQWPQEFCLSE